MTRSVVVIKQESGWALLLAAARRLDHWKVVPFIIAADHEDELFATCPYFHDWAARGLIQRLRSQSLKPGARNALLNNAIVDRVYEISQSTKILELCDSERKRAFSRYVASSSHWGFWASLRSTGIARPGNVIIDPNYLEPLRWLHEYHEETEAALSILWALIDKHQQADLTFAEKEEKGTQQILGGHRGIQVI